MTRSKHLAQESASRFRDNYINTDIDQGVKESVRRRYVKRVEQLVARMQCNEIRELTITPRLTTRITQASSGLLRYTGIIYMCPITLR